MNCNVKGFFMTATYFVIEESPTQFYPAFRIGSSIRHGSVRPTRESAERHLGLMRKTVELKLARI